MSYSYPIKHWLTTLLLGPVLMLGYEVISSESKMISDAFTMLFLFLLFGLLLSVPALLLYIWVYRALLKHGTSDILIKILLNAGGLAMVLITFLFILKGSIAPGLTISYSIALIVASLMYRIKREPGNRVTSDRHTAENHTTP